MVERGTTKFEVRFFRATPKRATTPERKLKHFVYYQWGRVWLIDDNGKRVGKGKPFNNYGHLIANINEVMRKQIMQEFKEQGKWK